MADELVFFPDYRAANPYQRLLYGHAGAWLHPRPGPVDDALAALRRSGPGERVVFHLHWEDAAYRNEPDGAAAWSAAQAFLDGLEAFAGAGGRVLWTLHNSAPHDGRFLDVHEALTARLPALADVVHVHSRAGAAWAAGRLGVAPERIAIVPHGSYLPLFAPLSGPPGAASRARLGLPADGRLLLLFGRLGGYKGGAELLRAFAAAGAPAGLRLAIAGKQVEPLGPALAGLPAGARERVHVVREGFVPDEEVEPLFAAADAVALPYRAILTSGGALLALSLARPVLAPALPSLRELLTDGTDALLYDPDAADGIEGALRRLAALDGERLAAMWAAAHATAAAHDWRQSGLLLDGVLRGLVALSKPMRAVP